MIVSCGREAGKKRLLLFGSSLNCLVYQLSSMDNTIIDTLSILIFFRVNNPTSHQTPGVRTVNRSSLPPLPATGR